jgi:polygalacturonase
MRILMSGGIATGIGGVWMGTEPTMSNVRDFGAVGDGQTNDTDALRHAVVAGGGRLVLPRGHTD